MGFDLVQSANFYHPVKSEKRKKSPAIVNVTPKRKSNITCFRLTPGSKTAFPTFASLVCIPPIMSVALLLSQFDWYLSLPQTMTGNSS